MERLFARHPAALLGGLQQWTLGAAVAALALGALGCTPFDFSASADGSVAPQTDATQVDATQVDATQVDATQADAAQADATPPDATPPDARTCTPGTPEICNGQDDDCDEVIDELCPESIVVEPISAQPLYGNTSGGTRNEDLCPAGEVLVGVSGRYGGNIDRVRGLCGIPTLSETFDNGGVTYGITIEAGATLPERGRNVTTAYTARCPADQAVHGISLKATSTAVTSIVVHCSLLVVSKVVGNYAIASISSGTASVNGTNGGTAYSDLLPSPGLSDRLRTNSNYWIDAIGIGHAKPVIKLRADGEAP